MNATTEVTTDRPPGQAWRYVELARAMNVSVSLIEKRVRLGLIKVFRVGRAVRIPAEEASRLMAASPVGAVFEAQKNDRANPKDTQP